MKNLKIGDAVDFSAFVSFDYDETNRREVLRHKCIEMSGVVVGKKRCPMGKLVPGSVSHGWDGEDYDTPYLRIDGAVEVWLVRTGWFNQPVLVHDDDILHPRNSNFVLPSMGRRPTLLKKSS